MVQLLGPDLQPFELMVLETVFFVVEVNGGGAVADEGSCAYAEVGDGLPVVGLLGSGNPEGERHAHVVGEGVGVGLVEHADFGQSLHGCGVAA